MACFRENYAQPTLYNIMLGKKIMADMYVERIPMADIPEDEGKAADFLHELYRKKVRLTRGFHPDI